MDVFLLPSKKGLENNGKLAGKSDRRNVHKNYIQKLLKLWVWTFTQPNSEKAKFCIVLFLYVRPLIEIYGSWIWAE